MRIPRLKIGLLIALIFPLISQPSVSLATVSTTTCDSLFAVPAPERVQIKQIQMITTGAVKLLSDFDLRSLFAEIETPGSAGAAAVNYMRALPPGMGSRDKAQIWFELTRAIVRLKSISFVSVAYALEGGRYLFRGGIGETLFIDADGTLYRTHTVPLVEVQWWFIDYSKMTRISPAPDVESRRIL